MIHFTPCLSAMYREKNLEERIADIRANGFSAMECWCLGDMMGQNLPELLRKYDMELFAFCPDAFILNDPAARDDYLDSLRVAIDRAKKLNCRALITQVGQDNGWPRNVQRQSIIDGLRAAAPMLEQAGIVLLVEPLNTVKDHIGYYLSSSEEAFEIIRLVGSPNVKVLYDVYHQLHMGEDVLAVAQANLELIGHFHIAGFPARDEKIFDGEYDFRPFLEWAKRESIPQRIGIECMPGDPMSRTELYRQINAFANE